MDEYFASLDDSIRLADEMQNKVRVYREWATSCGLIGLWQKKLKNYYGMSVGGNSSQAVTRGGSEGELSLIKVNDLHNLIQNQLVMVTAQRPAGQAKAVNADTQSIKDARLGSALAEYYMAQVGFEQKFVNVTECALLCDEGYVDFFWDKSGGDPIAVDPDTQRPEMSGDCTMRTHGPWNVARDPGLPIESQSWHIITYRTNRFDEAERYPEFRESILSVKNDNSLPFNDIPEDSDAIYVHLLVHDRTPAVPDGRYALLIGDTIVLDSKLPYKQYPVVRIAPSDVIDGSMGYSSANDILAIEETTDALHSIITTNSVNFGGQNIVGPTGANLNVTDLAKGTRYFELPPDLVDKIRPLSLSETNPAIFNYIQVLGQKKEQAVGSNSVVRGQPEGQLAGASGAALALIQAQAISFNSGIQRSYFQLLSKGMTTVIGILQSYADTPRVAKIVGKNKAQGLKEFKYTGKDLNSVSSIVYELVNPVSQTVGGRLTMAQDLIKAGMIQSPKQYINLVSSGQLEVLTQDDEADGLTILDENEKLSEGNTVQALIIDNHEDHIRSHKSVLSSTKSRENPTIVQNVLAHIQEHIQLWQEASMNNPGILIITKQQPLMPPPPPQGGAMLPPPGGNSPPPGAPKAMGKVMGSGAPPVMAQAEGVKPPQLPNVAGTNQKPVIPGVTNAGSV